MKTYVSTLVFLACVFALAAQAPQKFNYQAVARNNQGEVLPNQIVKVRASILDGSVTGTIQFSETHSVVTSQLGLFNLAIGGGTPVSGTFSDITWANGDKYLRIEMDATGGNNYTLVGTSQLLSTPYAQLASVSGRSLSDTLWKVSQASDNDVFHKTGNVGIGIENPQTRLDIRSNGNNWYDGGIAFTDNLANRYFMYQDLSNRFHIGYNNEKILSIISGDVKIGNYTPGTNLYISSGGDHWYDGSLVFNDAQANYFFMFQDPDHKLHMGYNGNKIMTLSDFGVGIGTDNPQTSLDIRCNGNNWYDGGIAFTGNYANRYTMHQDLTYKFHIRYNGAEIMTFNGAYVGFGTTSPMSKIQVKGGNVYIEDIGKGVIMKSPNGQCWLMTVSNQGQPIFSPVACP